MIWPVFVGLLVLTFRRRVRRFFDAVNSRVERGDSFEAGTSGIRLGASSPHESSGKEPEPGAQPVLDAPPSTIAAQTRHEPVELAASIHLAHTARREKSLDRGAYRYYSIRVFLESDNENDLDRVNKVVYHLHPTFYEPDRTVVDRETNFELRTAGWGMFNLTAEVHLADRVEPLRLERYINF
ncbi:pYEATS domain-containing protein [Herbihabitans rhizosphaerae]|uniref:pYEATS domain-containing protein n=1 Tax=Herbihabitans rhizosphaerae TaxID=1872711 RepID=UPI0013EE8472|nr:pYEATS domain-containing protein [Herbihabitans rhizosphaerae]